MSLSELAERCEQATGPDRLLDGEIWRAAHGLTVYDVLTPEGDISVSVPAVTASLDAAMTLVPEGWGLALDNVDPDRPPFVELWHHEVKHDDGGMPYQDRVTSSATGGLALALCAAALKARASVSDTHPKDGDVKQAPLVSGAVGSEASETPLPPKSQSCVSTEPIVE